MLPPHWTLLLATAALASAVDVQHSRIHTFNAGGESTLLPQPLDGFLPTWSSQDVHHTVDAWLEAHPVVQTLRSENEALKHKAEALESELMEARGGRPASKGAARLDFAWPHVTRQNASTEFSQERLTDIAGGPGRGVILTFVNGARLDFARTWAAHMQRLVLKNWLIGATDPETLQTLLREGIPCFDMHTDLPSRTEWAWGSASFHSLGPHKIDLIFHTLECGRWVERPPRPCPEKP